MLFGLFVKGLYMAGIFLFILLLGDSLYPGQLSEVAFTDISILVLFSLFMLEALFSFGKHD